MAHSGPILPTFALALIPESTTFRAELQAVWHLARQKRSLLLFGFSRFARPVLSGASLKVTWNQRQETLLRLALSSREDHLEFHVCLGESTACETSTGFVSVSEMCYFTVNLFPHTRSTTLAWKGRCTANPHPKVKLNARSEILCCIIVGQNRLFWLTDTQHGKQSCATRLASCSEIT